MLTSSICFDILELSYRKHLVVKGVKNMATYNKKIELKRVNMNLPSNLVQRVEDYALSLGVNSTNAYIFLLNQALDYKDTMSNLPLLMDVITNINAIERNDKETEEDK